MVLFIHCRHMVLQNRQIVFTDSPSFTQFIITLFTALQGSVGCACVRARTRVGIFFRPL